MKVSIVQDLGVAWRLVVGWRKWWQRWQTTILVAVKQCNLVSVRFRAYPYAPEGILQAKGWWGLHRCCCSCPRTIDGRLTDIDERRWRTHCRSATTSIVMYVAFLSSWRRTHFIERLILWIPTTRSADPFHLQIRPPAMPKKKVSVNSCDTMNWNFKLIVISYLILTHKIVEIHSPVHVIMYHTP